jgi:hypothetical protein
MIRGLFRVLSMLLTWQRIVQSAEGMTGLNISEGGNMHIITGNVLPQAGVKTAGRSAQKSTQVFNGQDSVQFGMSTGMKTTIAGLLGLTALGLLAGCKPEEPKQQPPQKTEEPAPDPVKDKPPALVPAPKAVYGPYTEGRSNGSAVALDDMIFEKRIDPARRANIDRLPQAMLELRELSLKTSHPFFEDSSEAHSLELHKEWLNARDDDGKRKWSVEHQGLSMSVLGYYAEKNGIHKLNPADLPPEIQAKFTEVQKLYKENLEPVLLEAVKNPKPVPGNWFSRGLRREQ